MNEYEQEYLLTGFEPEEYLRRTEKRSERMYDRRCDFIKRANVFHGELYPLAVRMLGVFFREENSNKWVVETTEDYLSEYLHCDQKTVSVILDKFYSLGFLRKVEGNRWLVYF